MSNKNKIGNFGQHIAVRFLIKRNYKIIDENFYTREGEIDIIAKNDNQIVFIEVKTRLSNKYGLPEEAVNQNKKEKIRQSGLKYFELKQFNHDNFRIDCIAIEIDKFKKIAKIRHHKNIY